MPDYFEDTYKLSNIDQAIEIATTLSGSWFRGHARVHGELTPGIFRQKYVDLGRDDIERSFIYKFMLGAPALHKDLPIKDDYVGWLFLMQHHGLPTRLLDWTESALIALFFAVSEHQDEDGELWALYPQILNQAGIGEASIPTPDNKVLQYLAAEPQLKDPEKSAIEEFQIGKIPEFPLALKPPLNFPRMVAQLSTFTIHPKPKPGYTIPEALLKGKYLVRYIIPSEYKERMLFQLSALGITKRTLFADLDSLSQTLIAECDSVPYDPPVPPQCDGRVDRSYFSGQSTQ